MLPFRSSRTSLALAAGLLVPLSLPSASGAAAPDLGPAPDFELTDQTGESFDSGALGGKVWIANFIFTRCRMTCPMQTARFADIAEALAGPMKEDRVELVSFSIEPEHDTPEVLREWAAKFDADPSSWHFLTGDREAIWTISRDGFHQPLEEDGDGFAHSSQILVVGPGGRLRGVHDGVGQDGVRAAVATAEELLEGSGGGAGAEQASSGAVRITDNPDILDPPWLDERAQEQIETVARLDLVQDFHFRDRREESGIDFRHEISPDGAKSFKVVHYDHGNGLAAADVDGDGWLDVYFTSQVGPSALYRNRGDGTFEDITEKAGVAVAEPIKVAASFADVDNDGDPDLFVTSTRGGNVLLENDGQGVFRDITRDAGLDYVGHSSTGVFFDFDNDGLLDLYLSNVGRFTGEELKPAGNERLGGAREYWYYVAHTDAFSGHLKPERHEKSRLYRNEGGNRFRDVSAEMGIDDLAWTGDAAAADFDGDGWTDLYVLNMQGHDEYYQNLEGKTFVRRSREVFPKTPWGSMGAQVLDWNRDGKLDLYVTDMHSDMMENLPPTLEEEKRKANQRWPESLLRSGGMSIFGNAFFEQQADGSFAEISGEVNAENYWPWGLSAGDLNADGWPDVFIASSMNFTWRYHPNSLLLNLRGERWVDAEFALGAEPRRDGRTAKLWFTLDCDAPGDRDHPDCQGRDGKIEIWDALGSRSSLLIDLEKDGDLDILTNGFNSKPMVLVSDLAQERPDLHALVVDLEGTRSNRDGLGARVEVRTADGVQVQLHDGRSGYLSQSSMPLYFGLGDAETAESVTVRWPSGVVQEIPGPIPAGKTLEIVEPRDEDDAGR